MPAVQLRIKFSLSLLGRKHVNEAYIGDDSSVGATCRRVEENRKRKEGRKKDTQNSGKLAIRPDHPRLRIKIKLCMVGGL